MNTTATLQDFDENCQDVAISYQLEQDMRDPEIFYIVFLKVLDTVTIVPGDINCDLEIAIENHSGKRYLKWSCKIEVHYLETVNA
jgi:hypothetical protein